MKALRVPLYTLFYAIALMHFSTEFVYSAKDCKNDRTPASNERMQRFQEILRKQLANQNESRKAIQTNPLFKGGSECDRILDDIIKSPTDIRRKSRVIRDVENPKEYSDAERAAAEKDLDEIDELWHLVPDDKIGVYSLEYNSRLSRWLEANGVRHKVYYAHSPESKISYIVISRSADLRPDQLAPLNRYARGLSENLGNGRLVFSPNELMSAQAAARHKRGPNIFLLSRDGGKKLRATTDDLHEAGHGRKYVTTVVNAEKNSPYLGHIRAKSGKLPGKQPKAMQDEYLFEFGPDEIRAAVKDTKAHAQTLFRLLGESKNINFGLVEDMWNLLFGKVRSDDEIRALWEEIVATKTYRKEIEKIWPDRFPVPRNTAQIDEIKKTLKTWFDRSLEVGDMHGRLIDATLRGRTLAEREIAVIKQILNATSDVTVKAEVFDYAAQMSKATGKPWNGIQVAAKIRVTTNTGDYEFTLELFKSKGLNDSQNAKHIHDQLVLQQKAAQGDLKLLNKADKLINDVEKTEDPAKVIELIKKIARLKS